MTNYSDYSSTINTFLSRMPPKPYCTDDLGAGLRVRPLTQALSKQYVQYNPPHLEQALVFDIDRDCAFDAASEGCVLQPSFITHSKEGNGHAHFVYVMKTPIAIHEHANMKPIRYAAAIQRAYTDRLGADKGYACLITKNPLQHDITDFNRMFELGDMDAWLDFEDKAPQYQKREAQGLGRNVDMFDTVRFEAYKKVHDFNSNAAFSTWCFDRCEKVNCGFTSPLPLSEPRATAKSIAKWVWKNRDRLIGSNINRGVMSMVLHEDLDLQQRQIAAAAYTHKIQNDRTRSKIQQAYILAVKLGRKPTQRVIASHTKLGIATVKRHWKYIQK